MGEAMQYLRSFKAKVCAALATGVFVLLLTLSPQSAFALAPTIQGVSSGQTNVSINLGEIEIFFGHNVAAGAVFEENAAHISLYTEDGTPVAISVARKYYGFGAPDAQNHDNEGYRRFLYVNLPTLEAQTTYTLYVSAGVRALGSITYDATSVTFATESKSDQGESGEGGDGQGGSGSGSGAGSGSGEGPDAGTGSGAGAGQPSSPAGGSSAGSDGESGGNSTDGAGGENIASGASESDSASASVALTNAFSQAHLNEHVGNRPDDASATLQGGVQNIASSQFVRLKGGSYGEGVEGDGTVPSSQTLNQNADGLPWFFLVCLIAFLGGAVRQKKKAVFVSGKIASEKK